jgi:WYL_2, Sm-like SH3 beta-barrel fold
MKKARYNRSEILTNAHSIKVSEGISFGDAQRKAWATAKAENVKRLLVANVVTFEYMKEDKKTGDLVLRVATGTLNTNLYHYENKGTQATINNEIVKYWDIDSNAFRCFKKCRFIRITDVQAVQAYAIAA